MRTSDITAVLTFPKEEKDRARQVQPGENVYVGSDSLGAERRSEMEGTLQTPMAMSQGDRFTLRCVSERTATLTSAARAERPSRRVWSRACGERSIVVPSLQARRVYSSHLRASRSRDAEEPKRRKPLVQRRCKLDRPRRPPCSSGAI